MINGRTVSIDDLNSQQFKQLSNQKQIFCCDCGENLVYRECVDRQHHFSHFNSDCSYPFREAESIEHESGKKSLHRWVSSIYEPQSCELERNIKETNQRADVFVEPLHMAIEFQCSVIHQETWQHRHELYALAKVHDLWILGYSMHRYQTSAHRYHHKINGLEKSIFENYGRIIYFDTLTGHFVFLQPDTIAKGFAIGVEYRFKPDEVSLKNGKIVSRFDFVTSAQSNRFSFASGEREKANETDRMIRANKEISASTSQKQVLASTKQINYIKYLLQMNDKKIPYKFHGILKEEAAILIKKLLADQTG